MTRAPETFSNGTPVAESQNYEGLIRAHSVTHGGATFVEWSSRYDSANSGAVGEFCDPIYQGLLKALKARLE